MACQLHIPADELLRLGLRAFLEHKLRLINVELFKIHGDYNISSVEEMDACYQDGTLDEADSWRDLQHLDHLEYKRDELLKLIESL
ncbi:MAG: hypothetical protein KAI83_00045 [Thiomargarita sp.]|nr:hypothetical protein [Thiomargarita sp.]